MHIRISFLAALACCLLTTVSCSDDDDWTQSLKRNDNANTDTEKSAGRLEMPHMDGALFYAPHYVAYEGRAVMNLAVEWSPLFRHSAWVAFSWDASTSQDNVKRGGKWKWDPEIPDSLGSVKEADHTGDGYDKGHLCASEDRTYCKDANDQTFYYSNISPQISSFNQKFWARLEAKAQSWGRMTQTGVYDTVYVAKGGNLRLLLTNFTGTAKGADGIFPYTDQDGFSKGGMAVPAYYFMALLARKDDSYQAIAFYVPHTETLPVSPTAADFQRYAVSIDELERLTGLDFFCNLPDVIEDSVEKTCNTALWNW